MANPWTEKNRPFWKEDPVYQVFNNQLYNEFWTFDQTSKICGLEKFTFKSESDQILAAMKEQWLKYISDWNKIEKIAHQDKTKGFVAIVYFFIVLPYEKLDDVGKYFTLYEANMINIAYFYNTNGEYLPFADIDELFHSGPLFPGAYEEWLNDKYNNASWWISYMVYEKNNGLKPIIDSKPAEIVKIK